MANLADVAKALLSGYTGYLGGQQQVRGLQARDAWQQYDVNRQAAQDTQNTEMNALNLQLTREKLADLMRGREGLTQGAGWLKSFLDSYGGQPGATPAVTGTPGLSDNPALDFQRRNAVGMLPAPGSPATPATRQPTPEDAFRALYGANLTPEARDAAAQGLTTFFGLQPPTTKTKAPLAQVLQARKLLRVSGWSDDELNQYLPMDQNAAGYPSSDEIQNLLAYQVKAQNADTAADKAAAANQPPATIGEAIGLTGGGSAQPAGMQPTAGMPPAGPAASPAVNPGALNLMNLPWGEIMGNAAKPFNWLAGIGKGTTAAGQPPATPTAPVTDPSTPATAIPPATAPSPGQPGAAMDYEALNDTADAVIQEVITSGLRLPANSDGAAVLGRLIDYAKLYPKQDLTYVVAGTSIDGQPVYLRGGDGGYVKVPKDIADYMSNQLRQFSADKAIVPIWNPAKAGNDAKGNPVYGGTDFDYVNKDLADEYLGYYREDKPVYLPDPYSKDLSQPRMILISPRQQKALIEARKLGIEEAKAKAEIDLKGAQAGAAGRSNRPTGSEKTDADYVWVTINGQRKRVSATTAYTQENKEDNTQANPAAKGTGFDALWDMTLPSSNFEAWELAGNKNIQKEYIDPVTTASGNGPAAAQLARNILNEGLRKVKSGKLSLAGLQGWWITEYKKRVKAGAVPKK